MAMSLSDIDIQDSVVIVAYYNSKSSCKDPVKQKIIFDEFFEISQKSTFENWSEQAKFASISCIKSLLTSHASVILGMSDANRLETLCMLAGLQPEIVEKDTIVTREALKCIANILLIAQELRPIFNRLNSAPLIYEGLLKGSQQNLSTDALFLYSRILFLSTAEPSDYLAQFVVNHDFCEIVLKVLYKIEYDTFTAKHPGEYTDVMLISELLKVVFSLTVNFPKSFALPNAIPFSYDDPSKFIFTKFERLFIPLLRLASENEKVIPEQVFLCILPILVNFLENFSADIIPSTISIPHLSERVVKGILEVAAAGRYCLDTESEYERVIPHLVLLKFLCHEFPEVKNTVSQALLPSDTDRLCPVGEGDSATARLAAVLRVVSFSAFKVALCELFFTLCDNDVETMIKIFGYGNVAGFLINKSVLPETISKATTHSNVGIGKPTNPITGQYQFSETPKTFEPMSEEEKLREAERLFVLFERMKRNPTIQIQNPVEEAFHAV